MNERGWYMMDMMEQSQSLNREALLTWIGFAFRNHLTPKTEGL